MPCLTSRPINKSHVLQCSRFKIETRIKACVCLSNAMVVTSEKRIRHTGHATLSSYDKPQHLSVPKLHVISIRCKDVTSLANFCYSIYKLQI